MTPDRPPSSSLRSKMTERAVLHTKKLDRRLIAQTRASFLPSLRQLKYVGRFLTAAEKRLVNWGIVFAVIFAVLTGGTFVYERIEHIPAQGGVYREGVVGQPKYLNPLFSLPSEVDADVTNLIYARLFAYDEGRQIVGDLAESYTLSSDGKVYTVKLKPDLMWADGKPITSQDVAFTIEMIQNPEVESPLLPTFQGVAVAVVDERTVRLTLKQAFAPFIHALALGIIPEHIWETVENPAHLKLSKYNMEPVGSGPWKVSRIVKREGSGVEMLELTPNERYYGPKPHITTLAYRFYSDYGTLLEALRTEEITATSFPPRLATSTLSLKQVVSAPLKLPQYTALFFNQEAQTEVLTKTVRQALARALDRKRIVSEGLLGEGEEQYGPILPGMTGFALASSSLTFSAEEAERLLDKETTRITPEEYFSLRYDAVRKANPSTSTVNSTSTELNPDVVALVQKEMVAEQPYYRITKKKAPLTFTITTVDTPEYERVAEEIAREWRSVGVSAMVRLINRQFFLRTVVKNREYDMVLYGEVLGGDPDPYPFWHSSQREYPGLNISLYSNRTVDKVLEDARVTTSTVERDRLYRQFTSILEDEVPAVFLYSPTYRFLSNEHLRNVSFSLLVSPSDRYRSFADWYLETTWKWKPNKE